MCSKDRLRRLKESRIESLVFGETGRCERGDYLTQFVYLQPELFEPVAEPFCA